MAECPTARGRWAAPGHGATPPRSTSSPRTADRGPIAGRITAAGSVEWPENRPFDAHDLARWFRHRSQVPGADDTMPLIAPRAPAAR